MAHTTYLHRYSVTLFTTLMREIRTIVNIAINEEVFPTVKQPKINNLCARNNITNRGTLCKDKDTLSTTYQANTRLPQLSNTN